MVRGPGENLSELVEACWSDALDDAQCQRLNALPADMQRDVANELRLATAIGALLGGHAPAETASRVLAAIAGSTPSRRMRTLEAIERRLPSPRTASRRWSISGVGSLAAASAAIAILWFASPFQRRDLPEIAGVPSDAVIESAGRRMPAAISWRLEVNDAIVTGVSGVDLRYADGTTVSVGGDTRITVAGDGTAKTLRLTDGSIEAEVAPQRAASPMVIATANASAVVVGTHFRLAAREDYTRLEVDKGAVRMTNADRQSVDVASGQYAVAAPEVELATHPMTIEVIGQLAGQWTFDDVHNARAPDSSGNHQDGVLLGSPVPTIRSVDGAKASACLSFDGDADGVSVASSPVLDRLQAFTVTAWINNRQANGNRETADYFNIASKGWFDTSVGWSLLWSSRDIGAEPSVCFFVRRNGDSVYDWIGFPFTAKNTWTHVAAVYDGSELTIYQDGVRKGGAHASGEPQGVFTDQVDLSIGGPKGFAHPWNGLLDEIAIYNRALSVGEIETLCHGH